MTKQRKVIRNADNEYAMPWGDERFLIGYVDEVNGDGAEEIAGFVPTRHELLLLVKHWYGLLLDNSWFNFMCQQSGSREWREDCFAGNRMHRIAELLGDDEVGRTIADVELEFSKEVDPEAWSILCHGDGAQRDAVAEKNHQLVREFFEEIKKAEQKMNQALGYGSEAAAMITFLHDYRAGRSISSILGETIDPRSTATDKQLAEKLLRILRANGS